MRMRLTRARFFWQCTECQNIAVREAFNIPNDERIKRASEGRSLNQCPECKKDVCYDDAPWEIQVPDGTLLVDYGEILNR